MRSQILKKNRRALNSSIMSAFRSVNELEDDLEGLALFIFVGNEFVCAFGGFRGPFLP